MPFANSVNSSFSLYSLLITALPSQFILYDSAPSCVTVPQSCTLNTWCIIFFSNNITSLLSGFIIQVGNTFDPIASPSPLLTTFFDLFLWTDSLLGISLEILLILSSSRTALFLTCVLLSIGPLAPLLCYKKSVFPISISCFFHGRKMVDLMTFF